MRALTSALTLALLVGGCGPDAGDPAEPLAEDLAASHAWRPDDPTTLLGPCTLPALPGSGDVHLDTGVVYSTPYRGTASAEPQRLDVAWPKAGADHPLVLVIHGGGWTSGSRLEHRQDILRLAGQGYVAAAVDYRLVQGWRDRFPAAPSDVRCAVRWAKANAARFGADPSRVLVIGASAGAQLAALLAVAPDASGLDDGTCELGTSAATVTAAVSYYGRMDLTRAPIPDYLVTYIGRDGDWMAREALGSAVRHVDRADAPMLLVHGRADGTVSIEQSRLMQRALAAAGVPVALVELADQGHAFPLFGDSGDQRTGACATLSFLAHFARPAPLRRPVRTVVFLEKATAPGEDLFVRGGHDLGLVARGAYLGGDEPLRYLDTKNATTLLTKLGDRTLDWFSDSALDWTTDRWPAAWGPERSYAVDGFGVDPENRRGPHAWKLDVTLDGEVGDWVELKAFLRRGTTTEWEGDVHQAGTPYATGNHWVRKGYVTWLRFGDGTAELSPLR